MFGLVNIAAKELIVSEFGTATWDEIRHRALLIDDDFVGMQEYPDDVTYRVLKAASAVLNLPADDLLKAFGQYWTRFVARRGFGELLDVSGGSLTEFLENLDNMHAQVGLIFDGLKPPSFRVTDVAADRLTLHYFSDRPKLGSMVAGMLEGLEAHFQLAITVRQIAEKGRDADHDIFDVRFAPRPEAARAGPPNPEAAP